MNKERLLKLAAFLETVPPERFDYNTWAGEDWQGKPDLSCGTTACAFGWATAIPEFAAAGLKLVKNRHGSIHVELAGMAYDQETGGYDRSLSSAVQFFDISSMDAHYLFIPEGSMEGWEATRVAQHIRNFVESDGEHEVLEDDGDEDCDED